MKRDIYKSLLKWKVDKYRHPLLVRGARQIGKTYIIEQFGINEFDSFVLINFERNPEYKDIFNNRRHACCYKRIYNHKRYFKMSTNTTFLK